MDWRRSSTKTVGNVRLEPEPTSAASSAGRLRRGSLPETAALAALSLDAIELTVNGRAEIVVQDADAYQKLLEAADRAEALEGIRRGLEDVRAGRTVHLPAPSAVRPPA